MTEFAFAADTPPVLPRHNGSMLVIAAVMHLLLFFVLTQVRMMPVRVSPAGTLTAEALEKAGDLRTYDAGLRANPNIRVIVNKNDFLLENDDLAWLHATFSPEQLTVFEQGGHLGNLSNPEVQKTILGALTDMKAPTGSHR